MSITCCKDCSERYLACWGSCEKYLEARAKHDAALAERTKKHDAMVAARALQFYSLEKSRRRKGR